MNILVINCGGSSIKYQLIDMDEKLVLAKGSVERIGSPKSGFNFKSNNNYIVKKDIFIADHETGLKMVLTALTDPVCGIISSYSDIAAIGHRVVHAGEKFSGSVLITQEVINALKECIELAPLHNPPNIMGIELCEKAMPGIPQVGVFDNALHRNLKPHVYLYGLPYRYYNDYGIRRYGFHGISFTYMIERASEIVNVPIAKQRIVSLQLGSGCTANAMKWGESVDVSTGFTPCEGLIQSTRSGNIDPAIITHIMRKFNLSPDQMDDILYKQSGWLGLSDTTADFRDVEAAADAGNEQAQIAIDAFVYSTKKYIGAYAAAMGGMDLLVIAGGVGEKNAMVRAKICHDLDFLGINFDDQNNNQLAGEGVITSAASKVPVVVVNTNEEIIIARETAGIMKTLKERFVSS